MRDVTPDEEEARERVAQSRAAIEAIEPSTEQRAIEFDWVDPVGDEWKPIFVQAELGMYPAQEFVTMVTEIIESFTQGEMGMKIGELFRGDVQMPSSFDPDSVNKVVEENMALVQAFIKLVKTVPGFELNIMCLSLGIPRKQWNHAKEQMQEPPHRGGLTVEDGFDILIWFIKQNGELLTETFTGKAQELVEVFQLHVLKQVPEKETESKEETSETEPETTEVDSDSPGGTPSSISSQPTLASD